VRVEVTRHAPEGVPEVEVTVEEVDAAVVEVVEVEVEEVDTVVEVEEEVEVELEELEPVGLVKHTSCPTPMVKTVGFG